MLRSVSAALVMSIAGVVPSFLAGALAVQIREELDFGASALGLAVSLFFAASTVTAVTLGKQVDRIGWQRAILIAATGSATMMIGIALFARSWTVLVIFMVLGGVANAVSTPAANLALARVVPPHRRALMFGIKQSAVPAAIMLAGLSVPVIGLTVGWRWAFAGAAVCPLIAALLVPRDRPAVAPPGRRGDGARRPALLFALVGTLGAASQTSLTSFLVSSSVLIGVAEGTAGLLLAVGSVTGIVVRVVVGWATDRTAGDGLRTVSIMLAIGGAGTALLATGGTGASLVIGTLLAFAGGWGWTGLFHFAVVVRNPEAPAAATGVAQAGLAGGATIGPFLFGVMADAISYTSAWTLMAVVSVIASILMAAERRNVGAAARAEELVDPHA